MINNHCSERDLSLLFRLIKNLFPQKDPTSKASIMVRYAYFIANLKGNRDDALRLLTPPSRIFNDLAAKSWSDYDDEGFKEQIDKLYKRETLIDCLNLL